MSKQSVPILYFVQRLNCISLSGSNFDAILRSHFWPVLEVRFSPRTSLSAGGGEYQAAFALPEDNVHPIQSLNASWRLHRLE